MKCEKCGKQTRKGKFCSNCGAPLDNVGIKDEAMMSGGKINELFHQPRIIGIAAICLLVVICFAARGNRSSNSDILSSFSYENEEEADSLIAFYKTAVKNKKDWTYVQSVKLSSDDEEDSFYYKEASEETWFQYYGELENGKPVGKGVICLFFSGTGLGRMCIGYFEDGQMNGYALVYNLDVNDDTLNYEVSCLEYEGNYTHGAYDGTGVLYSEGAVYYEGEFAEGVFNGTGVLYYSDGSVHYEGQFADGTYDGTGILYYQDNVICYEGEFSGGAYDGAGKSYESDGTLQYDGYFEEGEYVGREILFQDIPWGTNYTDVNSILSDAYLHKYTGSIYVTFDVNYLLLGLYSDLKFPQTNDSGDIKINAGATHLGYFAGYAISEESLFFAYTTVDGELTKSDEDTALYGARYVFDPGSSLYIVAQDLIDELTSIYGEPDEAYSYSIYEYRLWHGANGTELSLRIEDGSKNMFGSVPNHIYINYAWEKGDELLQAAVDTYDDE